MESDSTLTDLSSDLSSVASMSPIPDYPSPVSSQDQEGINGVFDKTTKKRSIEEEMTPVSKKRKRSEPKPRTMERLDLSGSVKTVAIDQKTQLERLLRVLRKRRKIVVIAGAGISVSAGSKRCSQLGAMLPKTNKAYSPRFPFIDGAVQISEERSQAQGVRQAIVRRLSLPNRLVNLVLSRHGAIAFWPRQCRETYRVSPNALSIRQRGSTYATLHPKRGWY